MKSILIIWGGWQGHDPQGVAEKLANILTDHRYQVDVRSDLGVLINENLKTYDVLIPIWSCGIASPIYIQPLLEAIESGLGLVTWHGGINWFDQADYYDLIGAYYLRDTPVESYSVQLEDHAFTKGLTDFDIKSETYYMLVNPMNTLLATTSCKGHRLPLMWTKTYGAGRVFYSSLAHDLDQLFMPDHLSILLRAIEWAAS